MRLTLELTEIEAKALVESINRAWATTPPGRNKRAIERVGDRIDAALRLYQANQIPERGAA